MNIGLLKRLRTRFLRMRHAEHFNMGPIAARADCGAVMCMAGHTLELAGYKRTVRPDSFKGGVLWIGRLDYRFIAPSGRTVRNPIAAAQRELGLSRLRAEKLFCDFDIRTPQQAAIRIQKIIESGEKR